MVGQWPLKPLIGVRIPVPQQIKKPFDIISGFLDFWQKICILGFQVCSHFFEDSSTISPGCNSECILTSLGVQSGQLTL